jgi:hypothetical protein
MSNLAYAAPVRRPHEEEYLAPVPRRVRIITTRAQRRARPKLGYALGATVVIFAIFLAQLLITIALSSGAYKIDGLQATQQNLGRTASSLSERLDTLGSSQNLEANALSLGMVGSSNAAFLRLSDGAVLGSASPAKSVTASSAILNGSNGSVPNSLLTDIPVIRAPGALTQPTGTGHGGSNAAESNQGNTESTKGQTVPAQAGTTGPTSSDSGDLPSPVTH